MHRHKRFRHGPPLFRPQRGMRFGGMFWLILLAFMFFSGKGNWWPGILIVIGIFVLFGSLFRDRRPPEPPPFPPDPPPFDMASPPPTPKPTPPPAEPVHRLDLLPATCPNCGGPVRPNEVKWTGSHSAACSYCGSNLQTRK